MITHLLAENLGLFEKIDIEYAPGLNVITGESGAGKTMLTKSFQMLAGEKAEASLIGGDKDFLYIEAGFNNSIPDDMSDLVEEDEELVLARKFTYTDKLTSKALVCGRSASSGLLRSALNEFLIASNQHAAIELKKSSRQRQILDTLVGEDVLEAVRTAYSLWKAKEKELLELKELVQVGQEKIESLKNDIESYNEVSPVPGELEELQAEQARLVHSTEFIQAATRIKSMITEDGLNDQLGILQTITDELSEFDPSWTRSSDTIETIIEDLRDIASTADSSIDSIDSSPERLGEVEARISSILDLIRRFRGSSLGEIIERVEQAEKELNQLSNSDNLLETIAAEVKVLETEYFAAAKKLTAARKKSAKQITKRSHEYLKELRLGEAELDVRFSEEAASMKGTDKVEIYLKANKVLEPTLLGKGASGGELSRVNLALSLATYADVGDKIFLFDEIDAGIGGQTAHAVGALLKKLSENNQVIVISHLAQIAVHADRHFLIQKSETAAELVDLGDDRDEELFRLMGIDGSSETLDALKTAATY